MPPAQLHSTLNQLITKLLMSLDAYNSTDTGVSDADTTVDSSGERARICLNRALMTIYSLIKDSKYLDSYPSTRLSSTAGTDYIELDPEAYLDTIESVQETTNQKIKLQRKSWSFYRKHFADPSQTTGDPIFYIPRGNRMYLAPRPASSVPYTIDFRKIPQELKNGGDIPLIPTHLDFWLIDEAVVLWYMMEDPSSIPEQVLLQRADSRQQGMNSVNESFDRILQAGSNTEVHPATSYAFKRPVGE